MASHELSPHDGNKVEKIPSYHSDAAHQVRDTFDKMNTFELIYEVVKLIPRGRVTTYGTVAKLAGNSHLSQIVGYALHVNPRPEEIPCHRVVNRFGEPSKAFAFGGINRQIELLQKEGVRFEEGRVIMKDYYWGGNA